MPYNVKERFSPDYESGPFASHLVLGVNTDETILNYQVEMIAMNSIPNILPLDVRQKDEVLGIYYNITSKLTLSQLLIRRRLRRNEFLGILSDILKTLQDCRYYLLYDKSFLIDEDYIFIKPDTLEVYLVYIPAAVECDVNQQTKDLISRLIMSSAQIDESSGDNFIQRIINYLKSESFNIPELYKLLAVLRQEDASARHEMSERELNEDSSQLSEVEKESRNARQKKQLLNLQIPKPSPIAPPPVKGSGLDNAESKRGEAGKSLKPAYIAIVLLVQLVILIGTAFGWKYILALAGDAGAAYTGIGLLIAAVEVLTFRSLAVRRNTIAQRDEKKEEPLLAKKPVNMSKLDVWSLTGELDKAYDASLEKGNKEKPLQPDSSVNAAELFKNEPIFKNPKMDTFRERSSDTVLLGREDEEYAYLQGQRDGVQEKIYISKNNFIIGRLKGQVDYLAANNAVGKVHSEIFIRNELFYIKDLNTKNGTFINDLRIKSNTECELRNNDKVSFANNEYIFIIPQKAVNQE